MFLLEGQIWWRDIRQWNDYRTINIKRILGIIEGRCTWLCWYSWSTNTVNLNLSGVNVLPWCVPSYSVILSLLVFITECLVNWVAATWNWTAVANEWRVPPRPPGVWAAPVSPQLPLTAWLLLTLVSITRTRFRVFVRISKYRKGRGGRLRLRKQSRSSGISWRMCVFPCSRHWNPWLLLWVIIYKHHLPFMPSYSWESLVLSS